MARKATWAGLACALWVIGFDVVPLAHMLFHDALDEHHHGHRHDIEDHHHDDEHHEAPSPSEHGDGSVAHRDLAAQTPVPAVPVVLEALLVSMRFVELPPQGPPRDRSPRTTRARAPPTHDL